MESVNGPTTSSCFPAARKKRSDSRRRPHPDPKSISDCQNAFMTPSSNGSARSMPDSQSCRPLSGDHLGNEKKPKKLKLKLGGVTHTLHANPTNEIGLGSGAKQASMGEHYNYELAHKSKRISKKRAKDEGFDEEDDEEIRYLKKLKASRAAFGSGDRQDDSGRKTKGIAKLMGVNHSDVKDYGPSGLGKDGRKKSITGEDNDYEVELSSDDELKSNKKRIADDVVDLLGESGPEMTMTTRKRALECPGSGGLVEFPNGLPAAPSKKQKLSEVEQQLRKVEAAQRRRSQAERAAKEAEAEAIRRILGQDSTRKKKEDKLKKQQEELSQEKTDRATSLGPNTIRWSMGPHGTIVTFSDDLGLPKIFDPLPRRYPPPREKCVGPNCTNEYKYRDSKSKLPLCSLHCYKAVQGDVTLLPAC